MKKLLLVLSIIAVTVSPVGAQTDKNSVGVTDLELVRDGDYVTATFTLHAGRKATGKDYNLVVNPVIRNGGNSLRLPSIVVRGKRTKVAEERHKLATGERTYEQRPFYTSNGGTVAYGTTFPYESWMAGSELVLDGISVGCCSSTATTIGFIAGNLLHYEPETRMEVVEVPVTIPRVTTGDRLGQQFTFVVTEADTPQASGLFDYNMPLNLGKGLSEPAQNEVERFINDTREGSVSIYFKVGSSVIDRGLGDNNRSLVELISVVRAMLTSEDTRLVRIVIAGFASPEGSPALNERLAWDRAVAAKNFLTSNSAIDPGIIHIYNGSVDWTGLRELVARSDMYEKYSIIDIIDNVPVWDSRRNVGRHGELMRLGGGAPYRYMQREFFPKLRQAAYIKVYYENI